MQGLALAEFLGLNRVNWEAPPAWCVLGLENANAVPLERPNDPDSAREAPARPAPKRIGYLRR